MAWYTISFRGQDTGIEPGFVLLQRLSDSGVPAQPEPAITEVGFGVYKFEYAPAEEVLFVIDANVNGASVPDNDRYVRGVLAPADEYLDARVGSRANPDDLVPYVTFTGGGDAINPTLYSVTAPRRLAVRVTFSEPVKMTDDPDGALNVANYSIDDLEVYGVVRVSEKVVELTTSRQIALHPYNLTVQNVVDLDGNPI